MMTKHDAIKHLSYKIDYAEQCDDEWVDSVSIKALYIAVRAMANEPKKGIWFPRNNAFQKWFRCSECAYRLHELKGTKFCPNCGADMRENGNETN